MISDTSDPGACLPGDAADHAPRNPRDFTVRWRAGARLPDPRPAGGGVAEEPVVDLRDRVDLSDRRRWERDAAREVVERIVFRLVGDHTETQVVVAQVMSGTGPIDPRRAVTEALALVLERQGPLGEVRILQVEGVAFADHRRRLCRELLRWPAAARVALALRHLAELDVAEVAAVMDRAVEDVREVVDQWWPDDAPRALNPLRHLDPPDRSHRT